MSPRMSADERRDQVVRAAVTEFSVRGLEGTSTGDIAKRVGVSQPYLFRLFPTKRDLFIAALEDSARRVQEVFTKAADGKYGHAALAAMGQAYQDLLMADRDLLNLQLQQFAACHDPEVQKAVRALMRRLWQHVENISGAPLEARVEFFARGMLCNTIAAMGWDMDRDSDWQPVLEVLRDEAAETANSAEELDARAAAGRGPAGDSPSSPEYAAYVERVLGGTGSTGTGSTNTAPTSTAPTGTASTSTAPTDN
ncbi:TetR/AcrR family transcriptional regulator [Catenulispora sp. NF23]|uniref:TetR/AcrR family transcriptional regulator n=1 Tax=Catenulispora pinistramenti TaxID=2705254 RepID=A0ABS5KSQ2_9ACTN|nr:TetR/AcrR family transcriptional regulator [Catenulispora pinistramenti]MBS2532414.1 TetR/AcrR family transcriptional regulator [Catenulispora pinistramenti]MBS2549073.1 TetR/AcrR family transcriptional regulator [Catenulispora pinistramenti]